jgi:hypothetical protein
LNRRRAKVGSRGNSSPWKRIGLSVPGWMLLLAVSCTGTLEKVGFQEEGPDVQQEREAPSFRETEFRFAMAKLENGDFEGARETLSGIAEPEDDQQVASEVTFALGVIKLLEMDSVERMRGCRDDFQAFADDFPGGPYREHAERIVQVLNRHIKRAQKEQRRIEELTRQVSDQEKVIQTLQYKIEKLEEIHRETEQKRHLLDGE